MDKKPTYRDFLIGLSNFFCNLEFANEKQKLRKKGYQKQLSIYGAVGDGTLIQSVRIEVFFKSYPTKEDIAELYKFLSIAPPTGFSIAIWNIQDKILIPVITHSQVNRRLEL